MLAARQRGVMTTDQAVAAGVSRNRQARLVGAGHWQRLHHGVLVTHGGPVPWLTRARGALLLAGPGAALSHRTAGHLHRFSPEPSVLEVSIPAERRVRGDGTLVVHRRRTMPDVTGGLRTIVRAETVLDLVGFCETEDDVVGVLTAAARARTMPDEVRRALHGRGRMRWRPLLVDVLCEVEAGIESPLERRYHHDVEGRHGLPAAHLQARRVLDGRWTRADCLYEGLGVRVELDGALAHPGGRTDADVWRDNAALRIGELTLRYRWVHVALQPCRVAAQVAGVLTARGWPGELRRCGPGCAAVAR